MDKILSIDFGLAKVGVAVSSGVLAAPLNTIKFENIDELLVKIKKIVESENPSKILVGISSGQIAKESKIFGEKLGDYLDLPVVFVDETLTSKDAAALSLEAGIKRKKRKSMEDAYAAALILQNYLDQIQFE